MSYILNGEMLVNVPGIVVLALDLPVETIIPVFMSPIAKISGLVGPNGGEEINGV